MAEADTRTATAAAAPPQDPLELLRSRSYLRLLLLAGLLGVPISALAYFFLTLITELQTWVYTDLPHGLGFSTTPVWWPVAPLLVAGVVVGLTIRYLPGRGGESPAEGFRTGPPAAGAALPGIAIAALASIGLGAVIGPEAPLIALGAGLAALAVRAVKRDTPAQAVALIGAAGSFAAISALLGSPLLGAVLLMEATSVAGAMMGVVLIPGLLCAGIGSLVFVGFDSLTGLGSASLAVPDLPPYTRPNGVTFLWAIGIGVLAALLAAGIRRSALALKPRVERRLVLATPVVGLAVAGLAIGYALVTDRPPSDVLFSGQTALGPLLANAGSYTAGALVLLLVCKSIAYALSLSGFRGGPVFPSMFIGAALGTALSHLPGLPSVAGAAIGIGAMCAGMLRLPIVSVLLATLLLKSDGLALMPVVIVAVVTSYVVTAYLTPRAQPAPEPAPEPEPPDVPERQRP